MSNPAMSLRRRCASAAPMRLSPWSGLQHPIDAHANLQPRFLGFDVHVGCADLHGILKQDCSRRTTGAPSWPTVWLEFAEVHGITQVFSRARAKTADFFSTAVQAVERRAQTAFRHRCNGDIALEDALQLVKGKQVQRIAQRHQQRIAPVFQHQCPKRRAAASGSSLMTSGRNGNVLRLTKGIRSWRASPLASSSSVMMPVSISNRPSSSRSVRCSSRVCCKLFLRNQALLDQHVAQAQLFGATGTGLGGSAAAAPGAAAFMTGSWVKGDLKNDSTPGACCLDGGP